MATTLQSAVVLDATAQLDAAIHHAAVLTLNGHAYLQVAGSDATRWLNGMVTNNVAALERGQGNYNFILNAQGRILGDCTIYREPQADAFLLATDESQLPSIRQHLEKFIIMDDVDLQPAASNLQSCLVFGPAAPELVRHLYQSIRGEMPDLAPLRLSFNSEFGQQAATFGLGLIPRVEFMTSDANTLAASYVELGAAQVSLEILEYLRILEGTPRYGVDIRNIDKAHDLPQETNQTRALHFAKGCYLGQEIVERIRSRGNVHRTFAGFRLEGSLPEAGTVITAEGKPAGEFTSVASIPLANPVQLALGYIRREALDRGLPLTYAGGVAVPVPLPYNIP